MKIDRGFRFWRLALKASSSHRHSGDERGVTLVELLTAAMITSLVTSLIGFGVITATQANKRTESIAARRYDLSRAFDFISNEIRMAHRINQTNAVVASNSSTLENVVTDAGLNLSDLGAYGTLVLYLEIPINAPVPSVCPTGGPNAGSPPPQPANYDRVVYDLRASGQDWLPPNSIFRYGRIPELDGTINPCRDPISSDTLVDAIANTSEESPACSSPGVRVGTAGFQACVKGTQVDLLMRSHISDVEIHRLSSTATSRLGNTQPIPVLNGTRQPGDTVDLSWTWLGQTAQTTFVVKQVVVTYASQVYSGGNSSTSIALSGSSGEQHCYSVTATTGGVTSPESNTVCFTK
ncbi:prepilin-type cleavage/methylation domain-containing protein [Acaryochloris sp. IP29b_bin.137]|uniref:prepilin-type cleavage/methylation domain-containing protein n=1 Tax=Acaryochloris sp. IP29b_bin.137 TaxID=2969217 RepID=UPI00262D5BF9|nr:prepilin-type cleavage/methylation domain-containing protein [Acaryochloris sp. IP29b_bin.137]